MRDFSLYVITGEQFHPGRHYLEVMEEAILGGADMVQLREKKKSKRELLNMARELKALCARYDVPLIINDHVDLVLAVDADGVHLGQDDLPLEEARKILGPNKIIGISTHKLEEAKRAQEGGADYIGVGPIFPTNTKEDVVPPVGLEYIRQVVEEISIPFVAIGGIKLHNVDQVLAAGAKRICVVSGIVGAENVRETARAFAEKVAQYGAKRG